MARSKSGARQPVSRVRPASAKGAGKAGAARPAAAAGGGGRSRAAGGPPHREVAPSSAKSKKPSGASRTPAPRARTGRATRVRPADAAELYERLLRTYPDAHCALDHRNAYELLAATILSAQCTDKRVNMVTPALFAAYPDPAALAAARQEDVEELVKTTGFFRNKAKSLIAMANALVERHGGEVPADMEALVKLPGVGRKTANVILGNVFALNEGIVVDTHVGRLSRRLGLASAEDPVLVEQALMPLFPRDRWTMLAHLLIEHGRQICDAKKPRCGECPLRDICPSAS